MFPNHLDYWYALKDIVSKPQKIKFNSPQNDLFHKSA